MKMTKIKRIYINYRISYVKKDWHDMNKTLVLIQLNHYYNYYAWQRFIEKAQINQNHYEFRYSYNKFEFIKLFKNADIVFLFGLSQFLDYSYKPQKILYFPVSGLETLPLKIIPKETKIYSSKGVSSNMIAEYILSMIFISLNNYHLAIQNILRNKWDQNGLLNKPYDAIHEKTIGVWGFGNNGKAITRYLRKINCEVLVTDIIVPGKNYFGEKYIPLQQADELIHLSDILVLAVPLNETTRGLVNNKFLNKLKPDAILINVSRGEVINEKALIQHLNKNNSFKAVLDVTSKEPLPSNSKLWNKKNAIITPHIAGNINRLVKDIQEDFYNKAFS